MYRNRVRRILKDVLLLLITFAAAALFLWGCSPCERMARRCPPVEYVRDSVWMHDTCYIERWHTDTVWRVRLERETVYVSATISDTAEASTAYAYALAWLDGTMIRLLLRNTDSADIFTRIYHERVTERTERGTSTENRTVVTVYKTRGIVKVGAWIGLASVIIALLRIVVFIAKRK